jgi:MFS transporter, DHA2 family, multidrug resistance protein
MDETKPRADLRFDWFGFAALAVGIGSLQMMLDRGEQLGWFGSSEIIAEAIISAAGFYFFFAHSLTTTTPFVRFEAFKDRNYVGGIIFMAVIGVVLFGTMALVTPFLQNVVGYPIMTAGMLLAARGIGTLISMMAVGRLMKVVEARWLILTGLVLTAWTLYGMVGFTNDTSARTIVTISVVQGVGLGLVFVPLSTVAFSTLPGHLRTEGTAILTLVRNIGSSIGISIVIANLTSTTTVMHANLAEYITPFRNALQMPNVTSVIDLASDTGKALADMLLTQQATIIAYANSFLLLMVLTLVMLPMILIIGSSRVARADGGAQHAVID